MILFESICIANVCSFVYIDIVHEALLFCFLLEKLYFFLFKGKV